MRIQTFRCSTVQEAVQKVRETLGPDASILHIRSLPADREYASRTVELDASCDIAVPSRFKDSDSRDFLVRFPDVSPHSPPAVAPERSFSASLHPTSQQHDDYVASLQKLGFSAEYARVSTQHCFQPGDSTEQFNACLATWFADQIPIGQPLLPSLAQTTVVALHHTQNPASKVLIELATQFAQSDSPSAHRVGFLVCDPRSNLDLPELLRAAERLDAAIEVISAPDAIQPALQRMQDCSMVFTQLDSFEQSCALLPLLQPDINYLHLAESGMGSAVGSELDRWLELPIDRERAGIVLELTPSLEHETSAGNLLEFLCSSPVPISYLSHASDSQAGMKTLQLASAERVVRHFTRPLSSTNAGHEVGESQSS